MADYSGLLAAVQAGLSNFMDAGFPGCRTVWTETTTWGNLPSIVKRVRTHDAVTVGIPYVLGATPTYPFGLTQAPPAGADYQKNICFPVETHTAAGYFDVIVAGYVKDAVTGDVTSGQALQFIINGVSLISDGATAPLRTTDCCAIALENDDSYATDVWLLGSPASIAAS
jgi:hypothetical protein